MLVIVWIKFRELKNEQPHVPPKRLKGLDERRGEQAGIEIILVRLAGAPPETRQVGELLDRYFISDSEGEKEILRYLLDQPAERLRGV